MLPRIVWLLLIAALLPPVLTQSCDVNAISERLKSCVISQVGISSTTTSAIINQICENSECAISCLTNAVGNCHLSDAFFFWEPTTLKVTYRAMCKNSQVFLDVINNCATVMFTGSCFSALLSSQTTAINEFTRGNYTGFKTGLCNVLNTYTTCMGKTPIQPSGTCTAAMATLANDFLVVSYSYSACNTPQTHSFFTTYAGDVKCSANHVIMTVAYVASAVMMLNIFI